MESSLKHFGRFCKRYYNNKNQRNQLTRATRRRVPCKWMQICWNSLVNIFNFDHEIANQGRRVWFSQWFGFNGKYPCLSKYLTYLRSSHCLQDINIWNIWPWKSRLTSQSTALEMSPFNGKYHVCCMVS